MRSAHLRRLEQLRRVRDLIDCTQSRLTSRRWRATRTCQPATSVRQFRLAYCESPYAYLMTRRIERAKALLRRGELSVTEVCFAVGCASLGTFSTRFKELVGVSPRTYRCEPPNEAAGMPPCVAKLMTKPIRNREAQIDVHN